MITLGTQKYIDEPTGRLIDDEICDVCELPILICQCSPSEQDPAMGDFFNPGDLTH